jgi:hypothetical protein
MKYPIAALLVSQAAAFTVVSHPACAQTRIFAGDYEKLDGEGKINLKVPFDEIYNRELRFPPLSIFFCLTLLPA